MIQAVQATPSVAAILASKLLDVDFWLGVVGIVALLVQVAYMSWKWKRDIRREEERLARGEKPPVDSDKAPL